MEIAQLALIARIKDSSIFELTSVAAYAGQIGTNGIKGNIKLPAALVMAITGRPAKNPKGHVFDILVITESQVFDKILNQNKNIKAASELMDYLSTNPGFTYRHTITVDEQYDYQFLIDEKVDEIEGNILLQTDRHTVFRIRLSIVEKSVITLPPQLP